MQKTSKKILILALALCLVLSMVILAACNDGKIEYTVEVTAPEGVSLSGASVRMMKADGSLAAEEALKGGKATFKLEPADYKATIVGLSKEYGFTEGTLSAEQTSCTIELVKLNKFTVTVVYPAALSDVYGNLIHTQGAATGEKVALYAGELADDRSGFLEENGLEPADIQLTDFNGVATFYLPDETYTVVLPDLVGYRIRYTIGQPVYTVSKTAPDFTVPFRSDVTPLGATDSSPLNFVLGVNTLPLTREALMLSDTTAIYYRFVPEKSGNYTFTTTSPAAIYDMEYQPYVKGAGSFVLALEAGQSYVFACGVSVDQPSLEYTVTIEEGGEIEQPPQGTKTNPIILASLADEYTVMVKDENSKVYYKYTPAKDENYIVSSSDENIYLNIFEGNMQSLPTNISVESKLSADLSLKAGTDYYLEVDAFEHYGRNVTFKIETKSESEDNKQTVTYSVTVLGKKADDTTSPLQGVTVTIRDEQNTSVTTDAQGKATFQCEAGTYGVFIPTYPEGYKDADEEAVYAVSVETPDITITLTQVTSFEVAVAIKYADGSDAPEGLLVRLVDSENKATDSVTDASGVAKFQVAPGSYTVQIPLFKPGFIDNGPQKADGVQFHDGSHKVQVTDSNVSITAAYQYIHSADVTVKNADGSPAVGVTVDIADEYNKTYSADTDENGVAHFDNVIDGDYDIFVDNVRRTEKLTVDSDGGSAQTTKA